MASSAASQKARRWRDGAIPPAPEFDGNVEDNPRALNEYKKRLDRWVRITREMLSPSEQALRARDRLLGDAAVELYEVMDSRYDCPQGIANLLEDLAVPFGEKEHLRQGGVVREYETISRAQGESVHQFLQRFRRLE